MDSGGGGRIWESDSKDKESKEAKWKKDESKVGRSIKRLLVFNYVIKMGVLTFF